MGTKIIGYILSIIGLVIIALSNKIISTLTFLQNFGKKGPVYVIVTGGILVIVGIFLIISDNSSRKIQHAAEEVPIYEGEGKKRKIVGYKRAA